MESKIIVVSYKRPDNKTCNLLKNTNLDWEVFIYKFDDTEAYIENYGENHVHILDFEKPNLPRKRQAVLEYGRELNRNIIMMDDDIYSIKKNNEDCSIIDLVQALEENLGDNFAISPRYNDNMKNIQGNLVLYKGITTVSIINISKLDELKYNPESKCEDVEFTIDAMLKGYSCCMLKDYRLNAEIKNTISDSGLSYRFKENKYIDEGSYLEEYLKKYGIYDCIDYSKDALHIDYEKISKNVG